MKIYIISIAYLYAALSFADCAINLKGDDICTGQRALYSENYNAEPDELEIVRVDFIDSLNRVFINSAVGNIMVDVEKLVGVEDCQEEYCKQRKVEVDLDCTQAVHKRKVLIQNVFSNGQVAVKERLFSKPTLINKDCIK